MEHGRDAGTGFRPCAKCKYVQTAYMNVPLSIEARYLHSRATLLLIFWLSCKLISLSDLATRVVRRSFLVRPPSSFSVPGFLEHEMVRPLVYVCSGQSYSPCETMPSFGLALPYYSTRRMRMDAAAAAAAAECAVLRFQDANHQYWVVVGGSLPETRLGETED